MKRKKWLRNIYKILKEQFVVVLGQKHSLIESTIAELGDMNFRDMIFFEAELWRISRTADEIFESVYASIDGQLQHNGYFLNENAMVSKTPSNKLLELFKYIATDIDKLVVIIVPALPDIPYEPLRALLMLFRSLHKNKEFPNIRILAYGSEKMWQLSAMGEPPVSPFNIAERIFLPYFDLDEIKSEYGFDNHEANHLLQESGDGIPMFVDFIINGDKDKITETIQQHWLETPAEARAYLSEIVNSSTPLRCEINRTNFSRIPFCETNPHLQTAFWNGFLKLDDVSEDLKWQSRYHWEYVNSKPSAMGMPKKNNKEGNISKLTDSEMKLLELLAQGKPYAEIASELHLTLNTVKSNLSKNIYPKLDVRNRGEATNLFHNYMNRPSNGF